MNPTGPTATPTGAEVCALSTVRVGSLAGRRRDRNSPRSPTCIHLLCLVCQTYSTCSLLWSPEWNEDPANAPDEDSEAQIQRLDTNSTPNHSLRTSRAPSAKVPWTEIVTKIDDFIAM